MIDNSLKSPVYLSSNYGNEGNGYGTWPQAASNSASQLSIQPGEPWQQNSDGVGGYGNQTNPVSEADNWGAGASTQLTDDQWNQVRSQIRQRWQQLSDEDLLETQGDFVKLCTLIQQRTGEDHQKISHELRQLLNREPESEGSASLKSHIM